MNHRYRFVWKTAVAFAAAWISITTGARAGGETLLNLLEQPFARFILAETDEGAALTRQLLGRPLRDARDIPLLHDRLESLRPSSSLPAELEARLARLHERLRASGGALTVAEENELRAFAGSQLDFSFDAGTAGPVRFVSTAPSAPDLSQVFLRRTPLPELTLGREFSALAPPSITPQSILRSIQAERGGEIFADTRPGKWVLTDGEGLRWGAEIDGRLPNSAGTVNVLEVQTPPLNASQEPLFDLPLRALLRAGAEPAYSVGGGHIHVDLARYLVPHPFRFASLVNYLMNYEELLNYVFANPGRAHATRKLSALLLEGTGETMSEHLGQSLNRALSAGDPEQVLKTLEEFALNEVGTRDVDINLRSWRGSGGKKTHGTLELRFFNTPKLSQEARLEDRLVRAIVEHAAAADADPIRYAPRVSRLEGESAYLSDERLAADFRKMTDELGLRYDEYEELFLRRIGERRHPGN